MLLSVIQAPFRSASAVAAAVCLFAGASAAAADCPAAPDHSTPLDALLSEVQQAETEGQAREIAGRMWELWADAPDEQAQEILNRGMTRRSSFDFLGALADFNQLIAYCPDYAEGYNQRAFVHYLRRDFASALIDLDKALELSPRHIAAMSGRALSLYGLSRLDEARVALAEALALNPWLPERHLADPGGPLALPGAGDVEL
ncbi:hypothetical protein RA19_00380 [Leisingera sp. ANG-M1]|uniref:tetratricopeptide repeat protein n=1 Tax=Leisingera sp. ANG-M1 TaxID=1577895 RepID=UPI00057D96BD|nr:tetratricopeptide repeat protein [Leisingera sp. ANG-M1]KIC12896.1 hypothetical protein RA19_00380 [Leisingera sp. ANG-M1]